MTGRLEDKVVIVTGAAGGLGSAICSRFAGEGALVLGVDVAGEACFHADVATEQGVCAMIEEVIGRFGRLDILVLNAGIQFMASISEFPLAQWNRLMDVMVKGPFLAMKGAWRYLTERPGGRIIVTASGSSFVAEPYKAAYVAAKHAVVGLVKVAAIEGAPFGLTVNAVAPGWMLTGMVERQLEDQVRLRGTSRDAALRRILWAQPSHRAVETSEVANVMAFIASPEASGINGACLPVDLGKLIVS